MSADNREPPVRRFAALAVCVVAAMAAPVANAAEDGTRPITAAESADAVTRGHGRIGGTFKLTDHNGKVRTPADFRGKLLLVYFGFTHCPDICPTDLMAIGGALKALGPAADQVQALFITLDPQRDTKELLATYVDSFHDSIIALTGDDKAIQRAAFAYKVYFKKILGRGEDDYGVDHSAYIYLMDRNGAFIGVFPPATPPDRIASVLKPLIGR
jgi:cytochrome oxidase Cu insertion factor (SCO1/SenC/PrrC family)